MPKARHLAPRQTESENHKATQPEKRASTSPQAAILSLQQTVGNRAVQRMMSDAKPESVDSGTIQRHLAPGMDAVGFGAVGSIMGNAAMIQGNAAQLTSSALQAQSALSVSAAHTCPQSGSNEEVVVPAVGGV